MRLNFIGLLVKGFSRLYELKLRLYWHGSELPEAKDIHFETNYPFF